MKKNLTLVIFVILPLFQYAQTEPWKAEDVVKQARITSLDIAKDNSAVVWVHSRPDEKSDKFVSDLWLTLLTQEDAKGDFRKVQLTRGKHADRSPLFSHDGESIYFLSSRKKGKALWALSRLGGEPYVVDSFKTTIGNIQWLNSSTLCFVSEEGKSLYEQEASKKKDNSVVVEDQEHFKPTRIFAYDLENQTTRRLTDNQFPIREYAVSKDGRWMVTLHILSPHYGADGKPAPTYYLWDIENGTKKQILGSGFQTPSNFTFTSDNQGFYFIAEKSSDPEWNGSGVSLLYYFDIASSTATPVPLNWDWGIARGYEVRGNDVLASLANGPTLALAFYKKGASNTWEKRVVEVGDRNNHLQVTSISHDGNYCVSTYSTASKKASISWSSLTTEAQVVEIAVGKELTQLNTFLDKKFKAQSAVVSWKGALGDKISGILYYPKDYQAERAYPLMLSIHGGPSGVDLDLWQDRWSTYPHLLAEKGMFVLKPNYHGSSNHGLAFVESIKKHYYEYELPDILSGVDSLVAAGRVDNNSLGVMGWSNGAILATMLTVQHPDRFKVCAAGAGDVNWTSDFGTCRFGVTFDQSYFGGAPWDNVGDKNYNEVYIEKSPLFELEKVTTPTIIFHGSEDRAVPRDQGWEYYRALQQIGKAPVRFLWFPGQRHGLAKLTHQRRKMKEELKWIDRYLLDKDPAENEAFKQGSPLAQLLKQEGYAHNEGIWGTSVKGKLIPETSVAYKDSIEVGIYELTQAQYNAFNEEFKVKPGRGNYPVVGLSAKEIQTYLDWLSQLTGQNYRLPTEKEAEAFQKLAMKQQKNSNTLTYWAGYTLTHDDAKMLKSKLAEVQNTLLKAVGTFPPSKIGKAEVYDLSGNAAEYFDKEGTLKPYGGSAYDFVDPASPSIPSLPEHTGFRVVKEIQ
ncbi:MAG: prolyl oligopeptidase family serine peptidase [Bacteroidota bacterium]